MTDKSTRELGTEGENRAIEFLSNNNYKIIEANYRVGKIGEVDIIAKEAEYICFIEVKTRRTSSFGIPSEAVNYRKQQKIRCVAQLYLSKTGNMNKCIRFDVVEVLMDSKNGISQVKSINLIKNAF